MVHSTKDSSSQSTGTYTKKILSGSANQRVELQRFALEEPDRWLPDFVDELGKAGQEKHDKLIAWLAGIYHDLPQHWKKLLQNAIWNTVTMYGFGFQSYCTLEGAEEAMTRLVNDPAISQENVGAILLTDADGSLLSSSLAEKPYETMSYILEAMVHPESEIRETAAGWLQRNAADLPDDLFDQSVRSLESRVREDDHSEVKIRSEQAIAELISQRHRRASRRHSKLEKILYSDEIDHAVQMEALDSLARFETAEALGVIVIRWWEWLAAPPSSLLFEHAEALITSSDHAILPLLRGVESHPPSHESSVVLEQGQAPALMIRRETLRLLSHMSEDCFSFEGPKRRESIIRDLRRYAVPVLVRELSRETDNVCRVRITRTLALLGGQQAAEALCRSLTSEERSRQLRQKLLSDYYLEPSKRQSQQASDMLSGAIADSKRTLILLQLANLLLFLLGIGVILTGLISAITGSEAILRLAGIVVAAGSLGALLFQLTRQPLDQIQRSLSKQVQVEAIFTAYIWELNLSSTYIQSKYVSSGVLDRQTVDRTLHWIERTVKQAVKMIHLSESMETDPGQG
ncbi:MAG: hypothetical protein ACK2T3_13760 [Candidatus Promineifilaceae bacterium]